MASEQESVDRCPTCGANGDGVCAVHPHFQKHMIQLLTSGIGTIEATVRTEFDGIHRVMKHAAEAQERALENLHQRVTDQGEKFTGEIASLRASRAGEPVEGHEKRTGERGRIMSLSFTREGGLLALAVLLLVAVLALGDRFWSHAEKATGAAKAIPPIATVPK